MSFEADVIAKYQAVMNGRIWWDEAPADMPFDVDYVAPFCVLDNPSGNVRQYVDNQPSEDLHSRVTFTVYGSRKEEAGQKMRELANVIIASSTNGWVTIPLGGIRNASASNLGLRGAAQDFGIWYVYPAP